MVAASKVEVKQEGYIPGSLDKMVLTWATRYWPDAQSDWYVHHDYYKRQFVAQMRADERKRAGE